MADGSCSGKQNDVSEMTLAKGYADRMADDGGAIDGGCVEVNPFYLAGGGGGGAGVGQLFDKFDGRTGDGQHQDFLPCEDDCRKKRCVDRYDSSESSDSGVAVLSCTDCSGSSTASSDITDPGSPFSTASSHSEDSGSQSSTKMPPTQSAHHPPWPWTTEECPSINKRSMQLEKTAFSKRLKSNEDTCSKQSPPCLSTPSNKTSNKGQTAPTDTNPSPNDNNKFVHIKRVSKKPEQAKITEYFKSQVKVHVIKSKEAAKPSPSKFVVDQQTQFNGMRAATPRTAPAKKTPEGSKTRKHHVTVPRKILPAPSKLPENVTLNPHGLANFAPTVTLTAVSFPPNLTYLHTKAPKPPDNSIFVPQFATITNDKISTIPIINRTPCLNVIHQPVQKITSINNFNCVKLNATVVPIVKLNALPSRLNGATLSVETAHPTVITAKQPKPELATPLVQAEAASAKMRIDEVRRTVIEEVPHRRGATMAEEKSPSPADSDSGVSIKDNLEVVVGELTTVQCQKSPILSQPKTIRFPPAKQEAKDEVKDTKTTHSQESGLCRWAECSAQFDTSGALLEHLQIKHVISQATQEQYVCLWLGCKVHGRTSCSRSWLERHVLAHAGTKPFRCIVDGCGQRFNSQLTLERHVNGHFTSDGGQNGSAKKSTDSSSAKLFKRNGKKIRFRRQPWSARMFDFIDSGIMEGLQHKLLTMTQHRTMGQIHDAGNAVNVHSQVMARRVEPDGKVKFLIKWDPVGIIPDEWVSEKEYVPVKSVPIPALHPSAKDALTARLFPPERRKQERRRKPVSKQQT